MKVAIFWDTAPYPQYMNQRFAGAYHLLLQGRKSAEQETRVLLRRLMLQTKTVQCNVHKSLQLVPTLSQISLFHSIHFISLRFNILNPLTSRSSLLSLSFSISHHFFFRILYPSYSCQIPCTSHP
jgi:hypothetical protein